MGFSLFLFIFLGQICGVLVISCVAEVERDESEELKSWKGFEAGSNLRVRGKAYRFSGFKKKGKLFVFVSFLVDT